MFPFGQLWAQARLAGDLRLKRPRFGLSLFILNRMNPGSTVQTWLRSRSQDAAYS
ncbi:MAG: hypothetical protein NW220_07855 [Leptolyngbyaceae cyanobacterium bins.349]|nr:hypothetical protein [Leptolyngbyaceae cyanobacterium bins.349]